MMLQAGKWESSQDHNHQNRQMTTWMSNVKGLLEKCRETCNHSLSSRDWDKNQALNSNQSFANFQSFKNAVAEEAGEAEHAEAGAHAGEHLAAGEEGGRVAGVHEGG